MRIRHGKIIPRDDGKRIEELVGAASTGTRSVSVAKMLAPRGWREPAQTPEFDEVVVVLKGTLTLVLDEKVMRIAEGETGLVAKGKRVVYRNDAVEPCEYLSICSPAFRAELAHFEEEEPQVPRVLVTVAHPSGKRFGRLLEKRASGFLKELELFHAELSISLVTDRAIRRLNRTWRKKDKATDVLSFPLGKALAKSPGPRLLGDVVISLDTARRQAAERGAALDDELSRYLAHGLLHLLGHDHETPRQARAMALVEDSLLGREGMVSASTRSPSVETRH